MANRWSKTLYLPEPSLCELRWALRWVQVLDLGREESGHGAAEGYTSCCPLDIFLFLQIGSYFGGELCGIDIDQDGETELLLIGAPLFYGEQRGGRVFIYQRKQVRTRAMSEAEGEKQRFTGPLRSQIL